jgi:hypothetical protein
VDDILEAKAKMMTDGYNPTLLVVAPDVWNDILTSRFCQVIPSGGLITQLFGMRVVVNNSLEKGKFICSFEWGSKKIDELDELLYVNAFNPSER